MRVFGGNNLAGKEKRKYMSRREEMTARLTALPANVQGALWLLLSAVLFVVMAVLVKYLGQTFDPFQVSFFRQLFQIIVILPFLIRAGGAEGGIRTKVLPLQMLRGFVGSSAMICGFYAFAHLPLADAQALNFSRTLFLVPLAALLLSEPIGKRRVIAALVGFGGVLIMLRPTGALDPAALVALLGAALVALATVLVKIASRYDQPITLMFYTGVGGLIVTSIPAYLVWIMPSWEQLALLAIMGSAGAASHNCFIRGYRVGEATVIAPFEYSRLIFLALAGIVIFGDIPTIWTLAGAAVIIGAALYIVRRESQAAREARAAEKAVERLPE